jgi:hypothetical protein
MKPEPRPRICGCGCMRPPGAPGMFGIPNRLKNSGGIPPWSSSSSSSSLSGVACLPFLPLDTTLMLTTEGPARSTRAEKSGRLAAALAATAGALTPAGAVAA